MCFSSCMFLSSACVLPSPRRGLVKTLCLAHLRQRALAAGIKQLARFILMDRWHFHHRQSFQEWMGINICYQFYHLLPINQADWLNWWNKSRTFMIFMNNSWSLWASHNVPPFQHLPRVDQLSFSHRSASYAMIFGLAMLFNSNRKPSNPEAPC